MMKNILNFLNIILIASLVFASCDPNRIPEFDQKDAFVAFDKLALTVTEEGDELLIPVSLGTIDGISAEVAFELVDGTAKAGVNYTLLEPASGTLSFTPEERTKYIKIKIIDLDGTFTGDLKFAVNITNAGALNTTLENKCNVTITDLDHPLAFILANYGGSAVSVSRGAFDFDIKIDKDEKDVNIVWISNLCPYFASFLYVAPDNNLFYGIVNAAKTEIVIPADQAMNYENIVLTGTDDPDLSKGSSGEDIVIQISKDGSTLTIPNAWGVNDDGWWNAFNGGVTLSKK